MNRRPSGPHSLLFEVEGPRADKPAKGQALRRVYDVSKRGSQASQLPRYDKRD